MCHIMYLDICCINKSIDEQISKTLYSLQTNA